MAAVAGAPMRGGVSLVPRFDVPLEEDRTVVSYAMLVQHRDQQAGGDAEVDGMSDLDARLEARLRGSDADDDDDDDDDGDENDNDGDVDGTAEDSPTDDGGDDDGDGDGDGDGDNNGDGSTSLGSSSTVGAPKHVLAPGDVTGESAGGAATAPASAAPTAAAGAGAGAGAGSAAKRRRVEVQEPLPTHRGADAFAQVIAKYENTDLLAEGEDGPAVRGGRRDAYDSEDSFVDDSALVTQIEQITKQVRTVTQHHGYYSIEWSDGDDGDAVDDDGDDGLPGSGAGAAPKQQSLEATRRESVRAFIAEHGDSPPDLNEAATAALRRLSDGVSALQEPLTCMSTFPYALDSMVAAVDVHARASHPRGFRANAYYATLMKLLPYPRGMLERHVIRAGARQAVWEAEADMQQKKVALKALVEDGLTKQPPPDPTSAPPTGMGPGASGAGAGAGGNASASAPPGAGAGVDANAAASATPIAVSSAATPVVVSADGEVVGAGAAAGSAAGTKPSKGWYRLDRATRVALYEVVQAKHVLADLEQEHKSKMNRVDAKHMTEHERRTIKVRSELTELYEEIVAMWPAGAVQMKALRTMVAGEKQRLSKLRKKQEAEAAAAAAAAAAVSNAEPVTNVTPAVATPAATAATGTATPTVVHPIQLQAAAAPATGPQSVVPAATASHTPVPGAPSTTPVAATPVPVAATTTPAPPQGIVRPTAPPPSAPASSPAVSGSGVPRPVGLLAHPMARAGVPNLLAHVQPAAATYGTMVAPGSVPIRRAAPHPDMRLLMTPGAHGVSAGMSVPMATPAHPSMPAGHGVTPPTAAPEVNMLVAAPAAPPRHPHPHQQQQPQPQPQQPTFPQVSAAPAPSVHMLVPRPAPPR